jgi:hypothetical protein
MGLSTVSVGPGGCQAGDEPSRRCIAQDDVPIRDFDTHGAGALPTETHSSVRQCLLLLGTAADDAPSWVRAGQALERVLLEITRHGLVASPLTQAIEVPFTRSALRSELSLSMYPPARLGPVPPPCGIAKAGTLD